MDALAEAWSAVIKADKKASELRGIVDKLRSRLEERAAQLHVVGQVACFLSSAPRAEHLAHLVIEVLRESLGTRWGMVWGLGEDGFSALFAPGLNRRQLQVLGLPAPQPFPFFPMLVCQAQWLDTDLLPPALRGIVELNLRSGEALHFLPFEHQTILAGFVLMSLPAGTVLPEPVQETLEILQRLFAMSFQGLWLVHDLEYQREALRRQAADLEARTRTLARQNLALREGETIRTEFLAFAAQELRQLLGGIMAPLSRLREHAKGSEQASDLMEGLLAGKHMAELLTDLAELSRPGGGETGIGGRPVDPGPLLAEIREILDGYPRRGNRALEWPEGGDLPEILADRDRLKQVLLSLCSGTLRQSPDGTLGFKVEREPLSLVFRLQVPVLDLHDLANAFDGRNLAPTAMYARGQGGAGLGLVVCRQLLFAMGGHLHLEPKKTGGGGEVCIELPLA